MITLFFMLLLLVLLGLDEVHELREQRAARAEDSRSKRLVISPGEARTGAEPPFCENRVFRAQELAQGRGDAAATSRNLEVGCRGDGARVTANA